MSQTPFNAFFGQSLGSSTYVAGQYGKQREFWTGQRHGKYYAGSYGTKSTAVGNSYYACSQAGVTLVAAGTTSYTGLAISNPAAAKVNLVVQKLCGASAVITAAVYTVGFAIGAGALSAPGDSLTPLNNLIGGSILGTSTLVSGNCTLPSTGVMWRPLGVPQIAAGTWSFREDVDGELIIPPGQFGCFVTVGTATSSGAICNVSWEEVAI